MFNILYTKCPKNNTGISGASVSKYTKGIILNIPPLKQVDERPPGTSTLYRFSDMSWKLLVQRFLEDGLAGVVQLCSHLGDLILHRFIWGRGYVKGYFCMDKI
jgi:hypothetical protein